uniref:Uncharacterized protein n=1 Tax=Rhizophora mucronata TaxID=61149 RepID=A0A2P2PHF8_RHIMU
MESITTETIKTLPVP